MKVAGIEEKVLVPREKEKFIKEQLRSMIENQWFWMDFLSGKRSLQLCRLIQFSAKYGRSATSTTDGSSNDVRKETMST